MIHRPTHIGAFQFVVVASLRAVQLTRGCLPKVDGLHKITVTAQLEVSEGRIAALDIPPAVDVPK
jgi:DNA-directed RNA polymerase subunit K/omega